MMVGGIVYDTVGFVLGTHAFVAAVLAVERLHSQPAVSIQARRVELYDIHPAPDPRVAGFRFTS